MACRNLLTLKKYDASKQQVTCHLRAQLFAHARALKPAQSVIAQLDPKSSGWVTAENLASYFVRILPGTCPVT